MTAALPQTPKDAARQFAGRMIANGYKPEGLFEYQDTDGQPLFWRIRTKHPQTGDKWIRPMFWNGSEYVIGEPATNATGKPLYRLPELANVSADTRIIIVEGEPKVDALLKLGLIATTSGSCSSADAADWTPLTSKQCTIWPDHDDAGQKYADAVAGRLRALGCDVAILDVAKLGLPHKGDVVDWLRQHSDATANDVLTLPVLVHEPDKNEQRLIDLIRADDVECRPVSWLWPGWLARGKLHILAGAPGTGKTTIALALAAVVSRGGHWPDGKYSPSGNVLLWSGEDSAADTLVPRLKAAGADLSRVLIVGDVPDGDDDRPFDPARDVPALEHEAQKLGGIALLIADPVVSAVTGDSHKNTEVRRALQPLVNLAERLGAAVLGITHFSKGSTGREPLERVTGSIAFGALARIVMVTAKQSLEDGQGDKRLLARAKSNIGPDGGGFGYDLEQTTIQTAHDTMEASAVKWGDALKGSARDLLDVAEATEADGNCESRDAADWLREFLANAPAPANEVKRAASENGFSWRTIQRAMRKAGVESARNGFGQPALWSLKGHSRATVAPVAPSSESGANGATGADEGDDLEVFEL